MVAATLPPEPCAIGSVRTIGFEAAGFASVEFGAIAFGAVAPIRVESVAAMVVGNDRCQGAMPPRDAHPDDRRGERCRGE